MTAPAKQKEVIVSHSHHIGDPTPWRWATKDVRPDDPYLRGPGQFADCEEAVDNAESEGHTVVEIRE